MVMPTFDKIDGERNLLIGKGLFVESNAGTRVLRRQTDGHCMLDTIARHLLQGVGDKWVPVAHTDIGRKTSFALHSIRLTNGMAGKRRAANQRIAMLDFLYDGIRHSAATRHQAQEFRYVRCILGASVRYEQDGVA